MGTKAEITSREMKEIQLETAVCIHEFCSRRKLRYCLAYGSLIGAVRHKGFIPWDDDIDLCMPRPDYEEFVRSFGGEYPQLRLLAPELDPHFYHPFAIVYREGTVLEEEIATHHGYPTGVKVDIFPIDGAPSGSEEYAKLRKKTDSLKRILFYKNVLLAPRWKSDKVLWFKTLVWKLAILPISIPGIQRRIRKLALSNEFASSEMVDMVVFPDPGDTRIPREVFEHYVDVEFEGHMLKAPRDYDLYLRTLFGDYMTLPPESERAPHHRFHAWWK